MTNVWFILIVNDQIVSCALSNISLTLQAFFPHHLENQFPVFYGIKSL